MDATALRLEVAGLMNDLEDDRLDVRDAYARLKRGLADMRATHQAVPDELRKLEKQLEVECCAQSQGR